METLKVELICFYCGIQYRKRNKRKPKRNFCSRQCYQDQLQREQSDGYTEIRHAYKKAEHRAKRSGIEFTISLEYANEIWLQQDKICSLSGLPISYASTKSAKRSGKNTASLDRIDSLKGYIEGNIQYILKDIQPMKWDMHEDKFIRLCRCIAEHTRSRKIGWTPAEGVDMDDMSGTMPVEATTAPQFDAEYYLEAF